MVGLRPQCSMVGRADPDPQYLGGGPEFLRGILMGLPAVLRVLEGALLERLASNV